MPKAAQKQYLDCISTLCADNATLASSMVPASICRFWDLSLGQPEWVLEGTGLSRLEPLPVRITLAQDLRLLANLLQNIGEAKLLELMLGWTRYPGESLALAAPNVVEALNVITSFIKADNSQMHLVVSSVKNGMLIEIDFDPSIELFSPIYEQVLFIFYFSIVRSFAGNIPTARTQLSEISIDHKYSDPTFLSKRLECNHFGDCNVASISIPASLCNLSNPDFDQSDWDAIWGNRQNLVTKGSVHKRSEKSDIERAIRNALIQQHRAPQITNIAKEIGCSKRTLHRILASSDTTFRALLENARMSVARDLLLETNLENYVIAQRLGYSESSAFVRSFRNVYKASPARWRRNRKTRYHTHLLSPLMDGSATST